MTSGTAATTFPQALRRCGARAIPGALVVAAGIAAYANSMHVPMQFDDLPAIVLEPGVHASELSLEALGRAAIGFPLRRWLVRVSFAANHAVHGLEPFGYHVVNLAIHVFAALMVMAVGRRLLERLRFADEPGRRRAAAIAALLFVVHPVNTQAVTYVVQRMTSMGAAFALTAVWCWLVARERAGWRRGALLVAAAFTAYLAAACKENYVVLPVLVAAVEWAVDPDCSCAIRARWRIFAAAALLVAVAGVLLVWSRWPDIQAEQARFQITVGQRAMSQGRVLVHYLSLIAFPWPGRLHVDYAFAPSTGLLTPWTTAPALAAIAALIAAAVVLRRRAPIVTVAIAWFLVALLVEQTILPLDLVFEHRVYFAGVGLFILAGAAAERWVRMPIVGPWGLAGPVSALLAVATVARNAEWADPARLYAGEEGSGPAVVRNLLSRGVALGERGQLDEAERAFRRTIELAPREMGAYVNMGNVELARGRLDAAEGWYRKALDGDPKHWDDKVDALYNLGALLERESRILEATDAFTRVVQAYPRHSQARFRLASLRHDAGDVAGALSMLEEGLRLDAGFAPMLGLRARVLLELGRRDEALEDARRAVRLAPGDVEARKATAAALLASRRTAEAHEAALDALRLAPDDPEARGLADATR